MWTPLGYWWDLEAHFSTLYAQSEGKQYHIYELLFYCHGISMIEGFFLQQFVIQNIPALSLPDVCTNAPLPGKAFCDKHCRVLEGHSPPIPTDVKGFLKFCRVIPATEGIGFI